MTLLLDEGKRSVRLTGLLWWRCIHIMNKKQRWAVGSEGGTRALAIDGVKIKERREVWYYRKANGFTRFFGLHFTLGSYEWESVLREITEFGLRSADQLYI